MHGLSSQSIAGTLVEAVRDVECPSPCKCHYSDHRQEIKRTKPQFPSESLLIQRIIPSIKIDSAMRGKPEERSLYREGVDRIKEVERTLSHQAQGLDLSKD